MLVEPLLACSGAGSGENVRPILLERLLTRLPALARVGRVACWAATAAITVFACPLLAAPGAPWAVASVVSGEAQLLRGNSRLALVEGLHLQADDIVEVGTETRFVGLEWANGNRVGLGPQTRVWLAPKLARSPAGKAEKTAPDLYVLKGWIKTVAAPSAPATSFRLATPYFDLQVPRSAVVSVQNEQAQVFAESGVTSVQRLGLPATAALLVNGGELLTLGPSTGAKPVLERSATPAFLKALPRPFVDPLPSRPALLRAPTVVAKRLGDVGYADARDWLNAEPRLRTANLARWRPLAQQVEFRKGLVADMAAHPEWQPVLFPPPPKPPKPPAPPAQVSPAPAYGTRP